MTAFDIYFDENAWLWFKWSASAFPLDVMADVSVWKVDFLTFGRQKSTDWLKTWGSGWVTTWPPFTRSQPDSTDPIHWSTQFNEYAGPIAYQSARRARALRAARDALASQAAWNRV